METLRKWGTELCEYDGTECPRQGEQQVQGWKQERQGPGVSGARGGAVRDEVTL